ncbi:hypothetical protein E4U55_001536 [Claviceps digitariae]|nr:hypothetical protein E4U55_001536 [Claviceps digitariae]
MPCCLAKLRHLKCGHTRLLKLGCTDPACGDGSLCPSTNQQTLLLAKYRWRCEDCLNRAFSIEDLVNRLSHKSQLDRTIQKIKLNKNLDEQSRQAMIAAIWMRNDHANRLLLRRRTAQLEEAQLAEQWVFHYGTAVFELLHPLHGQEESASAGEEDKTTQQQPGQVALKNGHDHDDHHMDQFDELDEATSPAVYERRTPQQLTMWLDLLLSTKHPHMMICEDASRNQQKDDCNPHL